MSMAMEREINETTAISAFNTGPYFINLVELQMVNRIFARQIAVMVIESERRRKVRHWRTYSGRRRKAHFRRHVNRIAFLTWMGIQQPAWYFQ